MFENVSIGCSLHCLVYLGRKNNNKGFQYIWTSPPQIKFAFSNQAVLVAMYLSFDSLKYYLGHAPQFTPEDVFFPHMSLDHF